MAGDIRYKQRCDAEMLRIYADQEVSNEVQICTWCSRPFPLTSFTKSKGRRKGRDIYCRLCKRLIKHGLTYQRFLTLLARQGGKCAACPERGDEFSLEIDHDHSCCPGHVSCGRCVRGLLCSSCNRTIGMAGDCLRRLTGLTTYLQNTPTFVCE